MVENWSVCQGNKWKIQPSNLKFRSNSKNCYKVSEISPSKLTNVHSLQPRDQATRITSKVFRFRYAGDKKERTYSSYPLLTSAVDGKWRTQPVTP
jgi:hypothetical protein